MKNNLPKVIINQEKRGEKNMSAEQSLFDQFVTRKENGEELDFKKITYDELLQLFDTEKKPDAVIGELFGVTKGAVRKKRDRLDIKNYDMYE